MTTTEMNYSHAFAFAFGDIFFLAFALALCRGRIEGGLADNQAVLQHSHEGGLGDHCLVLLWLPVTPTQFVRCRIVLGPAVRLDANT